MALAGGPAAVTAWLREIGIEGMRVDRTTAEIGAEIQAIMEAAGSHGDPNNPAVPAFDADPRDQATPTDMLRLLVLLADGHILNPTPGTSSLRRWAGPSPGPERIRGLLPAGTPVAHKTGTAGGIANDAGLVTLPDGRRFAVAIFTKGSTTPPADRDRAVAETARVLYDFLALEQEKNPGETSSRSDTGTGLRPFARRRSSARPLPEADRSAPFTVEASMYALTRLRSRSLWSLAAITALTLCAAAVARRGPSRRCRTLWRRSRRSSPGRTGFAAQLLGGDT